MRLTASQLRNIIKEEVSNTEAMKALNSFSSKYPNLTSKIDPEEWQALYVKRESGAAYGGGSMNSAILNSMFLEMLERSV
jgi:hypothetical protein